MAKMLARDVEWVATPQDDYPETDEDLQRLAYFYDGMNEVAKGLKELPYRRAKRIQMLKPFFVTLYGDGITIATAPVPANTTALEVVNIINMLYDLNTNVIGVYSNEV